MGAAVTEILLTRAQAGDSQGGMRWSPPMVVTGAAAVVALLAALLRLVVNADA